MADNVIIPASGTGDATPTIAADDVGGAKYQRVKISVGADGVVGDATPANPLPVDNVEMPAAAVIGDTDANPTTTQVASVLQGWTGSVWQRLKSGPNSDGIGANGFLNILLMLFNGTTYDRIRGDAANGMDVDVTRVGGTVTVAGTVTTTPPSNASTNVAQVAGTTADTNSGNKSAGTLRVTLATDQVQLTNALKVDPSAVTSPVSVANPVQAATGTLANVAASASSVTLQASNAARKGLVIVNDSTSILYVKFGSAASTTSFTYFLAASVGGVPATLELPPVTYTGIVTGIWASAVGNARVTELT